MYGHGYQIPKIPKGGGALLPLDEFANLGGWSVVRNLSASALDIHRLRSGGGGEQNFTEAELAANDDLTFAGANDGLSVTLFDQGAANNLTQATAGSQAVFISSGVSVLSDSIKAVDNTADFGWKTAGNLPFNAESELWFFCVVDLHAGTNSVLVETSIKFNNNVGAILINNNAGNLEITQNTTTDFSEHKFPFTETGGAILSIRFKANTLYDDAVQFWINGVEKTKADTGPTNEQNTQSFLDATLNFGARNGNAIPWKEKMQDLFILTGDRSADRVAIETEMNNFYSKF